MVVDVSDQDGLCSRLPDDIPVVDFELLDGEQCTARDAAVEDVGRACRDIGCFRVVKHGISQSLIDGALEAASAFFDLSSEEKEELASDDVRKPVRYGAANGDNFGKSRALLKHYAHPLKDWIHMWPHKPPEYRERMGKYAAEVRRVALQLTDAILESLGLGRAYLTDKLEDGAQMVAVNCYPPRARPGPELALPAHSDYGLVTVLLQSADGLQIAGGHGSPWRPVPLLPGALHVHIGDHMEVLSNGRYRSLLHRVLQTSQRRVSIASVHSLSLDDMVGPAGELVGRDGHLIKKYRESSFKDFLAFMSSSTTVGGRSYIESLMISSV